MTSASSPSPAIGDGGRIMSPVVVQRRAPFTIGPEFRTNARERTEQRAASAAALIERWFDDPRGDRRLLERAREALEQALAG